MEEAMKGLRQAGWFMGLIGWWLVVASQALAAETVKVAVMDQQLVMEKSKAGKTCTRGTQVVYDDQAENH
jgi:hypothetical protein